MPLVAQPVVPHAPPLGDDAARRPHMVGAAAGLEQRERALFDVLF